MEPDATHFIVDRICSHLGVYEHGGKFALGGSKLESSLLNNPEIQLFINDGKQKTLQAYSIKNDLVCKFWYL